MTKEFTPRGRFQTEATKFLLENDRANLHIDMGLGKTVMVLNAIATLLYCGETHPVLVIAPKRVAQSVWSEEAARWSHLAHLRVASVIGTAKERIAALEAVADIYCINYENLPWLVTHLNGQWPYRTIVADESTKLKSHRAHFRHKKDGALTLCCTGGKRTTAIARLAFTKTKRFWNLTGTPSPNGLVDLYGQQWFIDQGESLCRSYTDFEKKWFRTGYNGFTLEMLPHAEQGIREAIAPTTFTLRADDYLELGEEITNTLYVDMPSSARALYDEMERNLFIEITAGEVEAFTAATKSTKLHQLSNGAVYYDKQGGFECTHDAKLEALSSVIEEAAGMPVICVYTYQSDLERLKKAFPQGKAFADSKKVEDDFKAGKLPLLFMHPDSGGHGIDGFQHITNIICFFSVDWNGESRAQIIARVGKVRQYQAGFDRPTMIHQIICRNSIDEDILDRIRTKRSVEETLKQGLARRNLR